MEAQLLDFDLKEGERLKEEGIAQATNMQSRQDLLLVAKAIAVRLVLERGRVTADDVFIEMEKAGYHPEWLGNAAGCLFRGKEFTFSGQWEKSKRVSNHARVNRVWVKT